jgi:predicted cobalt transporter CbtA
MYGVVVLLITLVGFVLMLRTNIRYFSVIGIIGSIVWWGLFIAISLAFQLGLDSPILGALSRVAIGGVFSFLTSKKASS